MSSAGIVFDCSDPAQRALGIDAAVAAVKRGELVVLPTDTVYGVGADAFSPTAVRALLAAKGRGRHMPPPVLVGSVRAAVALVDELGLHGQELIDEFWPGALTLVCHASRTLSWDLGETKGTVAVRMPLHPLALELLKQTGPMAVSSANRSGVPPATTAAEARRQLGESVSVYLDAGPCTSQVPSSIVDLTSPIPRLLRVGAIPRERLRIVAPVVNAVSLAESAEPGSTAAGSTGPGSTTAGSVAAGIEGSGSAGSGSAGSGSAGSGSAGPDVVGQGDAGRSDAGQSDAGQSDAGPGGAEAADAGGAESDSPEAGGEDVSSRT